MCDDCAEHIARERASLPGLDGPALHIAVGALYGGGPCDHVDYDGSDVIRAYEALWSQALRDRDRARADATALREHMAEVTDLFGTVTSYPDRVHPGRACVRYGTFAVETHEKVVAALRKARELSGPNDDSQPPKEA